MKKKERKGGFTLVELMVVAIIVAILAAVAIPLMSGNKKRAMVTEAEAGCGTARTALRVYFAEHGNHGTDGAGKDIDDLEGINDGDLDGRYFDTDDYSYSVTDSGSNYVISCVGSTGDVSGVTITLNQDGAFTRTGL